MTKVRTKRELEVNLQGVLISCPEWVKLHFDKTPTDITVCDIEVLKTAPNDFKSIMDEFLDDVMSNYTIKVDTTNFDYFYNEPVYDYVGGYIELDLRVPCRLDETPSWYVLDKISEDVKIITLEKN